MNKLKAPISNKVWDIKYRYRKNGSIIDQSIEESWDRVAKAVAKAEKKSQQKKYENEFYNILENFHFLPGGRILAGAGTSHQVTLLNCFVMDIAEDSLSCIFDALKEGALTLQQGGGVGYDFSVLRPKGEPAKRTGISASGPVSFMRIWDTMCSILLSTGARRGAMMGVLRCDHPDILDFILAKRDPQELRHFNVSVMVSDEFMEAVQNDKDWALVFPAKEKTVFKDRNRNQEIIYRQWGQSKKPIPCIVYERIRARILWETIIRSAYDYAEPGVLFGSTINKMNNLWYREHIDATNPCGEIPLPPYGACNLGAINLTPFVISPFSTQATLDWMGIEETTRVATRFLDNVISISNYPLPIQKQEALRTRRIGLGITGLADVFVMLGIPYGSAASLKMAQEIMRRIAETTWLTSIELAREKGVFKCYEKKFLRGEFVKTLSEKLKRELVKYGVRNSHHNTIAPTGTISLLANNVSNGIEPIFQAEYNRHVRLETSNMKTFHVEDYAYHYWKAEKKGKGLPPAWIDTSSLSPFAHLEVQSVIQPYIDNAISKTINLPKDFPFEKVTEVYTKAYSLGLKGCTIFRPNPVTGSVLETSSEEKAAETCCQYEE